VPRGQGEGEYLNRLGEISANRYDAQIRRYYDDQRLCPSPLDDGTPLALFPELDNPF